jgi:hypothetical protein
MSLATRIATWTAVAALCACAVLYLGDYLYFHYRLSRRTSSDPVDTVQIRATYEIPHKDGRAEFVFGPKQTVTCVHSIFPHMGDAPCWYVERSAQAPIQM